VWSSLIVASTLDLGVVVNDSLYCLVLRRQFENAEQVLAGGKNMEIHDEEEDDVYCHVYRHRHYLYLYHDRTDSTKADVKANTAKRLMKGRIISAIVVSQDNL